MTPFECFKEYLALKSHFKTKSYDYIRYNGATSAKQETFEKRNDKAFFYRLSKLSNPFGFLLANIVYNDDQWIGDLLLDSEAENNYKNWKTKQNALYYFLKNDLSALKTDFNSNILVEKSELPYIITLFLHKKISLESLVMIAYSLDCISYWDKKINDPLYSDLSLKIKKYLPFLQFEKKKVKEMLKSHFI